MKLLSYSDKSLNNKPGPVRFSVFSSDYNNLQTEKKKLFPLLSVENEWCIHEMTVKKKLFELCNLTVLKVKLQTDHMQKRVACVKIGVLKVYATRTLISVCPVLSTFAQVSSRLRSCAIIK